ncbi:putative FBD-associated F-box protein At5g53635 isoform X2 [Capsella rubella]|uniref:putative FBD-associated F-box protein At5g53635 isoform X2 n=1 Tax=Capsella rubella TaxID=81985 RepID=UPI000CD4C064|nr:putative FBD-associated F-box protein At5g53635 isoform X2 [Capsella rubella]
MKRARSKGLSNRLKKDRISQLPDPLICHILSHLPTKEAVSTSVLSTRWRSLWLWLPSLELDSREKLQFQDLSALMSFGDRFFDSTRVSYIHKLDLTIDGDASYLTSWINAAVKRRIQHLSVRNYKGSTDLYEIPISLYSCDTLVSLTLSHVALVSAEFVSLPCLKTMCLKCNVFSNEATFETLVSRCPVLENLVINVTGNETKVYRVHSPSLKMLTFARASKCFQVDYDREVIIDAPLLCSLNIIDFVSKVIIVNNMESLAEFDVYLVSSRNRIRSLLYKISRVRDMTITNDIFEGIHHYSQLERYPQFCYLSRLSVLLFARKLNLLAAFLESCPNLKSLVLVCTGWNKELSAEEMNQISSLFVPKCLKSSLEYVDFKTLIRGHATETKLVRYFLENSAILKNVRLCVGYHPNIEKMLSIREELLKIPRASTKCELDFHFLLLG